MIIKEIQTKRILTKSNLPIADYSVNPYVGCTHSCKYCYASFMRRFSNHNEPWGEFLDVKYWGKINNPERYNDKELFIGSVTDPYLPQEKIYKRTRELLKQLQGSRVRITIQTKSDLVLRDIDLLKSFVNSRVGFSINTLDEDFKNDMDKAASISKRINAMKILHEHGIKTTCFISPIFPEITNVFDIIDKVKNYCNFIWLENLNLRGDYKSVILNYIKIYKPDLLELYKDIYNLGNRTYWQELDEKVKKYAEKNNMLYLRNKDNIEHPFNEPPIIINFFYHEEIKKSATKKQQSQSIL